jgi:D-xylose transport system ATP-binding protein
MVSPVVPLIEMRNIYKSFGGVRAVQDVSLQVAAGEVLGVLGHNGAGKSTLIRMLSGAMEIDSGTVLVGGEAVTIRSPRDARTLGIETIYQNLALADNLDAVGNLFLGRELRDRIGLRDDRRMAAEAAAVLRQVNPRFTNLHEPVRGLSGGQRQSIAIARAIHFKARVLVMDEPTAALGPKETAAFKEQVARLKEQGVAIILISHDMDDVVELTDRVLVLANGRTIGTRVTHSVTKDDILRLIIVGNDAGATRH